MLCCAGGHIETTIDTQCYLFRCGNLIVVAFRGTQPVNFFDWMYDFTISVVQPPSISMLLALRQTRTVIAEQQQPSRRVLQTVMSTGITPGAIPLSCMLLAVLAVRHPVL